MGDIMATGFINDKKEEIADCYQITSIKEKAKGKQLFLIKCRGMKSDTTGVPHGIAYVVADNTHEAYAKLRNSLDDRDLGFPKERELESVTLIAEAYDYTDAPNLLII